MHLDSPEPSIPLSEFVKTETRFNMLWQTHPEDAERFLAQAQQEVDHRYRFYKQLSELEWSDTARASSVKAQVKTGNETEKDHG